MLKLVTYSRESTLLQTVYLHVTRDRLKFFLSSMNPVQRHSLFWSREDRFEIRLFLIRLRDRVLVTIVRSHTKQPVDCDYLKQVRVRNDG